MRTVCVVPRSTITDWGVDVCAAPGTRPMAHAPGASDSVTVPSTVMARTGVRESALAAAGDGALVSGRRAGARSPSDMRSASSRRRSESRLARTASAASVRRRISAYRTAYVRVVRSAVSSMRTSRVSVSRNARKRDSSIAMLSWMPVNCVLLSPVVAGARPGSGTGPADVIGTATTSTGPARMVESITTTTSPDCAQLPAMSANPSATMPRRAARGRF